jgi:hypothetical protein
MVTKMTDLVLDFQGFKDNDNGFVIKELAVASFDGSLLQHWFVQSPFPYKWLNEVKRKECDWITDRYHGISWKDGDVTLRQLCHRLAPILKGANVFVKGVEKKRFVEERFSAKSVTDLDYYPSLKSMQSTTRCAFHAKTWGTMCALDNVFKVVYYNNQLWWYWIVHAGYYNYHH